MKVHIDNWWFPFDFNHFQHLLILPFVARANWLSKELLSFPTIQRWRVRMLPLLSQCFYDMFTFLFQRLLRNVFYQALGSRKLTVSTWNPFKIFRRIRNIYKRLGSKNISGNLKGEGLVQGGIVIFDKLGARYAYREETGMEVPTDDIIAVVRHIRSEADQ